MITREFELKFLTPAFLGDADQSGSWRLPPFKNLLRKWWRVAHASHHGYAIDINAMRAEESRLFGSAADAAKGTGGRSAVRLRLDLWRAGQLSRDKWTRLPEVAHREAPSGKVDSGVYLGWGPVGIGGRLKGNVAIRDGESAMIRLAYPDREPDLLESALGMMALYGTLGGRSRNGWGSFKLTPIGDPLPEATALRNWVDCLDRDWPHAIGMDEKGPLIWATRPFTKWQEAVKILAAIKIGLRTQFGFVAPPHPAPLDRHWLSYPVGKKHKVDAWGAARLPNSLYFKVRESSPTEVLGMVFHVPCLPPPSFTPDIPAIKSVWTAVHRFLDSQGQNLTRTSL